MLRARCGWAAACRLTSAGKKVSRLKHLLRVSVGILLFLALVLGLLAALNRFLRPSSTVVTNPCDPPCWHGIRPGETSSWGVLTILEEQPWVRYDSIREWLSGDELSHLGWEFRQPAGDAYGYAYFDEDRCIAVSILTFNSLTLSDAFGKVGEPELMWLHATQVDRRQWLEVTLLYPARGVLLRVDLELGAEGERSPIEIRDRSPVARVTYFAPSRFDDLLSTEILVRGRPGTGAEAFRPWPGLGVILYEGGDHE
jgi:hypothetical protein